MIFLNATQQPCRTVWLSHTGTPRVYNVLQPGEAYRQPTFTSHPWRFEAHCGRDLSPELSNSPDEGPDVPLLLVAGDQAVFYPPPLQRIDAQPPIIAIRMASLVPWSPEAHACFPATFRAVALSLLMAHHRLSGTAGATAGSTAQSLGCASAGKAHLLARLVSRLGCCSRANAHLRGAQHASDYGHAGLEQGNEATILTLGSLPTVSMAHGWHQFARHTVPECL